LIWLCNLRGRTSANTAASAPDEVHQCMDLEVVRSNVF
jgi:hypothetical protein